MKSQMELSLASTINPFWHFLISLILPFSFIYHFFLLPLIFSLSIILLSLSRDYRHYIVNFSNCFYFISTFLNNSLITFFYSLSFSTFLPPKRSVLYCSDLLARHLSLPSGSLQLALKILTSKLKIEYKNDKLFLERNLWDINQLFVAKNGKNLEWNHEFNYRFSCGHVVMIWISNETLNWLGELIWKTYGSFDCTSEQGNKRIRGEVIW